MGFILCGIMMEGEVRFGLEMDRIVCFFWIFFEFLVGFCRWFLLICFLVYYVMLSL